MSLQELIKENHKLSITLKEMLLTGRGYRSENYSGSKIRKLEDVVYLELSNGNTDIINFIFKDTDSKLTGDELAQLVMENSRFFIDKVVEVVKANLSGKNFSAIWLTTKERAINRYNEGLEEGIDEYILPKDFVVISDLGGDGALFVWESK